MAKPIGEYFKKQEKKANVVLKVFKWGGKRGKKNHGIFYD